MSESGVETSAVKRPGRRFGCLLSLLSGVAIIALALGLSYFVWYSTARSELDAEIAAIESRGEPLWFKDLAPQETGPEHDGTAFYLKALAQIQTPSSATANLALADSGKPPSEDPLVLAVLARNREVLDLLAEALRRPNFRLPIDYNTTQPFSITLDSVQGARDLARLLAGDVTAARSVNDQARAIETIERMFDLSELLRDEPFTITQLVRIAISAMAQESLKQALAQIDLTPEQFAALDDRFARMESEFTLAPAMMAERASSFTTLHHLDENIDVLMEGAGEPNGTAGLARLWTRGPFQPLRLADEAYLLRIMAEVVQAIDRPGREGADAMHAIESRVQNAPRSYVFSRLLLPAVVNVRTAGLRHREKLMTARLGMRVDRHFAEHGRFPASLDELVDDKLPGIPVDLFVGNSHIYRLLPDGFVIYPVGPNGIDDGGGQAPDNVEFNCSFEVHYRSLAPKPEEETVEKGR